VSGERDMRPAVGTPGEPGEWSRSRPDADVAIQGPGFRDARESYIFGDDTGYARVPADPAAVAASARRARTGPRPDGVQGPVLQAPVWTWEVPAYFWLGGIAAGASLLAAAYEVAGDARAARVARLVTLGAAAPSPALLVADLGRPARFLNMLRIVKVRSPMSTGAWTLFWFTNAAAGAVAGDVLGRPRLARRLGFAAAALAPYLGTYTAALLASTAVPAWSRSRALAGPIFMCTSVAGGSGAVDLALAAAGRPSPHPARAAAAEAVVAAAAAELVLAEVNERRLGRLGAVLTSGRAGAFSKAGKATFAAAVVAGAAARARPRLRAVASALAVGGALAHRAAWWKAGPASATDDEAVAAGARGAKG
jgi:formate-dependent nitrite reductase membrane component NrfD